MHKYHTQLLLDSAFWPARMYLRNALRLLHLLHYHPMLQLIFTKTDS